MRLVAAIFFLIGACIITVGALWLNIEAPRLEKLPIDYRREDTFSGTYRLLNPATGQVDEIPVTVRRIREAVGAQGNRLLIKERVTSTSSTDETIPQLLPVETNVAVDRTTRLYLPGGDEVRSGGMHFPPNVSPGKAYSIWVASVGRALPARYRGEAEMDGLQTLRFMIDVTDAPLTPDPQSGFPRVGDVRIEYQVESRSGRIVDMRSESSVSLMHPENGRLTEFASDLRFTRDALARSISNAKTARMKLLLLTSYVPWLVMGLGMLFSLYGMLLYGIFRWRRMGTA